jgi:hypothetical protein
VHSRFDQFRTTPLGQQLEALIDTPQRYIEYAALSRVEVPAVSALLHDLQATFPEIKDDQVARQFCGAMVAEVMRRHHHDILRPRGRVPGDYFTYGAVWSARPRKAAFDELLARMASMPAEVEKRVTAIPAKLWRQRPEGTGFAVAEHLCHLRDLDAEIYADRLARLLREDAPELASVNGFDMAAQRHYLQQDGLAALPAFAVARAALCQQLSTTTEEQRQRWGIFAGQRRITLADLVQEVDHHDRTHLLELDELAADLALLHNFKLPRPEKARTR